MKSNMEMLDIFPLDPLVQLPGTYESPDYFPDCIAVAAEECSGSYSQGSSSPEAYLSATDDTNIDLLDDLPHPNEEAVKELVNELVYEDPSFGSVLIDDINNIFNDCDDPDAYSVFPEEGFVTEPPHVVFEAPTRRKQRIVPMASEPFEYGCTNQSFNDTLHRPNFHSRKRSRESMIDVKYPEIKLRVISPALSISDPKEPAFFQKCKEEELSNDQSFKTVKEPNFLRSVTPDVKKSPGVRPRKRGLTHDERKERKKQSNRNASYRYRQRKKEELDNFLQSSAEISEALEKEKEAYFNVVEEFIRCIKHAKLVSDARG